MNHALPILLLALPVVASPVPGQEPQKPEPQWIWSSGAPADGETIWTRGTITVAADLERATLWGACDNHCEVFLDGTPVAAGDDWAVPFRVDVTEKLEEGATATLAAWGRNDGGAAGLWLELVLEYADGRERSLVTDDTWLVAREATPGWRTDGSRAGWTPAHSFGELGVAPWGTPTGVSDGSVAGALPAEELVLPEGFAAELVYSVPKGEQGSWVSLTVDPEGRLVASDQYGALYRVTPPPLGQADGAPEVQRLDLELGMCHGLLFAFDALYAVVGEGSEAGLYRVTDSDGDDRLDRVEYLKHLRGSGEHGPHAVVLHPDGRSLVIVGGNHTKPPEGIGRFRPTPVWGEDQLLPRLPDPNGHAVGVLAPGGWIVRTDPDGREWELVAMGFRNAYDLAFDPDGELFTFDSDMEWDVGLPWYRPTRICQVTSGADFGWRFGSGKFPAHYPDSVPGVVDVGLSSPTGVVFGTETAFHGPYRRALFAADWAYGTLYAVHLQPWGAASTGRAEAFASGKPFQITDLAVGHDGALYVITGGRRTQSGLYRIYSTREAAPRPEPTANVMRDVRRRIERGHGADPGPVDGFWDMLGSPDRFLAHAARTALEQSPVDGWAERALADNDSGGALQALLALVRTHPEEYAGRVLERMLELPFEWEWGQPEMALPWLRLAGLVLIRGGEPDPDVVARLAARLEPRFPSGHDELDRELLRLLCHLQVPAAAEHGVAKLEAAATQEEALHCALCLRVLERGWTLSLRRRYFQWLNGPATGLPGGHSLQKYVDQIRADAIERLPAELAAWPDLLAPPPETPAAEVIPASFVRAWTIDDLVPHLDAAKRGRSFEQGERAFAKATCVECHRIGMAGGGTGPDLTGAGNRFSARDLIESMIMPSAVISDQYQETDVLTKDEVLYVGRVVEEDEERLVLFTLPPQEEQVELLKADITLRRPHPLSRMPSGLADVLTREELLDLVAYLLAGADAQDPAFRD